MQTTGKLSALLIDLSGTLHIADKPTPRAAEAIQKLRSAKIPIRFCSNTSKESSSSLLSRLEKLELDVKEHELFTSLNACRTLVEQRNLKPYLLLSPSSLEDFGHLAHIQPEDCDSVVIGLAPDKLNYKDLNVAFRILAREPVSQGTTPLAKTTPRSLIATHQANYIQDTDALSLGPGPFVRALASAASVTPEIVGKPSSSFFKLTLDSLQDEGLKREDWPNVGIVGDDVFNDLGEGALDLGLKRYLVKTGKYREGDEKKASPQPDATYNCFADLVDELCAS
ncbi:Predicted sugar phosphatase (HAD superfamily) [Phaffia rhodozyma]|uniref:Haloacid dehalogenase-like hydrolase domain-containing protein 2 n=1 Tax=Phaffia rhodozyma TaxID=264483 RepID=A0A0F7SJV8_PHARH|nr:Predicted sugar phosphatase (HAD superfamily) [Phaffia rhodozyma]